MAGEPETDAAPDIDADWRHGVRASDIRNTISAILPAGRLTARELVDVSRAVAEQVNSDIGAFLAEADRLARQVERYRALIYAENDQTQPGPQTD